MRDSHRVQVTESSQVGETRRLAAAMGRELGFNDVSVEHMAIVATELATNLLKHGGGGHILLRTLRVAGTTGLEALALDQGPGIRNLSESLRDGHSTAGSAGKGLGAIQRLSSLFDIYSRPDKGTAVLSRIWERSPSDPAPLPVLEVGAVCLPIATEEACGDAWALHQTRERTLILLADGLGHGEAAAEASAAAVQIFEQHAQQGPAALVERMHAALRSTRGAAVAVTEVLWGPREVRHAGLGNICGRIFSGESCRNMVSRNGTVGLEAHKIEEVSYPWPEGGLLVLHSDGLATHWNLDTYPGLAERHPALVAGVLYRDHNRVRDDSTVVVIREARSSP